VYNGEKKHGSKCTRGCEGHEPSPPRRSLSFDLIRKPEAQPRVEAGGQAENVFVTVEGDNIPSPFEQRPAMTTLRNVLLHRSLQRGIQVIL